MTTMSDVAFYVSSFWLKLFSLWFCCCRFLCALNCYAFLNHPIHWSMYHYRMSLMTMNYHYCCYCSMNLTTMMMNCHCCPMSWMIYIFMHNWEMTFINGLHQSMSNILYYTIGMELFAIFTFSYAFALTFCWSSSCLLSALILTSIRVLFAKVPPFVGQSMVLDTRSRNHYLCCSHPIGFLCLDQSGMGNANKL